MATLPLTPVMMIEEVSDIDCQSDGAIITFESYGAPIRIRLTRHQFRHMCQKGVRLANAMQFVEQQTAEIIPMPSKRRA